MKKIIFFLLFPLHIFSQTQIGSDIDGEATSDYSGSSVSLNSDGTIVAIGADGNDGNGSGSGHVRVYEYSSGSWSQLGSDIDGEADGDYSGNSVSLSNDGTRVAIGAYQNDGGGSRSGHVRVYEYSSGSWSQLGSDLDGEGSFNFSGTSVALSGQGATVAIGTVNTAAGGNVRVYGHYNDQWNLFGNFDAEATNDSLGQSVSLSDNGFTVAMAATGNDANGSSSGHVRVYKWDGIGSWNQLGSDIDGEAANDNSGTSVSLSSDGTIVAIGAWKNDGNGSDSGHVRVYKYSSGSWTQLGSDIDGEAASDYSGNSVSLSSDGTKVAIGAKRNDGNGSNSGHVRVYEYSSGSWTQLGSDIDGEAASDESGGSVSLSSDGTKVAIGADGNDGNGSDSGHVRVYDILTPLSVGDIDTSNSITAYPNPTADRIYIESTEKTTSELYNLMGRKVRSTNQNQMDLSTLGNGGYILNVITTNKTQSFKILKQ